MNESACGDVLYHGMLQPPEIPLIEGLTSFEILTTCTSNLLFRKASEASVK